MKKYTVTKEYIFPDDFIPNDKYKDCAKRCCYSSAECDCWGKARLMCNYSKCQFEGLTPTIVGDK